MAETSLYSTRFKVIAACVLTFAAVLFGLAITLVGDGDDDPVLRGGAAEAVENLIPRRNAQVPRQSNVGIDLATGWGAALVVDGVEIPEDELQVSNAIGLIEFTPGPGKAVEELDTGRNCVSAVVWSLEDGRGENDRTIPWCFDVV